MMIYKLSGDVDELLGRPVGEVVAEVESVGDSIGVDPMNVVPIPVAFDESVTAEQLPIPWEQIDEVGEVRIGWNPIETDEVVSVEAVEQSSFCEMLPLLDPIPVGDTTTDTTPADDASSTTPAGPTNEQVIARKLQLCDLIQHVGDEIQAVDEEIAELSAGLKAAKKLRESKLERLQELSQELKNARRDLAEKQGAAATESDASDESDDDSDDDSDDELSTREEGEGTDATDFDPDAYNPWDHWEQGRAITCVRLLVATEGMVAGTSCSVFDVEPPQVEGDSFSGSVTVFRLGSDRETVVLSKRECAPMLPGVKEPPIGHRIGVRPKKKKKKLESATKQNQPEDDSWKTVPVSELDIPSSLVAILVEDNSIRTIGDIQEFTRWNRLTDLKKVGEAKAEKIDEALVEFWKKR